VEHRYLVKPVDHGDVWNLQAEEVKGYKFLGWYKEYIDNENYGIVLTINNSYSLTPEELNSQVIYTAVYQSIPVWEYAIHYHGLEGNVIYSVPIYEHQAQRTFVDKHQIIIDELEMEVEVPIDTEVFSVMAAQLGKHQVLKSWYYENDGCIVDWDSFKEKTVEFILQELGTEEIHLYPIIYETSIKNASDETMKINGLDAEMDVRWDCSGNVPKVEAFFYEDYRETSMKVIVGETIYGLQGPLSTNGKKDIEVKLTLTEWMGDETVVAFTDEKGVAAFPFLGTITIQKFVDEGTGNSSFLFSVQNYEDTTQVVTFLIEESTDTIKNTVEVKVPYGIYTIEENMDWAWRYQMLDGSASYQTVTVNAKTPNANCIFQNQIVDNKWLDFTEHIKNEFGVITRN